MKDLFVAIDGNSLMHRAFHAIGDLNDPAGNPVNAVFGFVGMLLKLLSEREPKYIAVAFDMHGKTFRHERFEAYKGTRKPTDERLRPQFPLIKEVLRKMGVAVLETPAFEADDILGTLARKCEAQKLPALLVTGDRDALQLVTETTHLLYTKRGITDTVEFTPEEVFKQYGVTPSQVPDLKGLMGDASDNIPGVPGVGEKTAVKLLQEYGTLQKALDAADAQKGKLRERLMEHRDLAELSLWLATISREAPIACSVTDCAPGDISGAASLFQALGFRKHLETLRALSHAAAPAEEAPRVAEYIEIDDLRAPEKEKGEIALCVGEEITLATRDACYRMRIKRDLLSEGLEPDAALRMLEPLLRRKNCLRLFGAKRFLHRMEGMGVTVSGECVCADALLAGWLLDPSHAPEAPTDAAALFALCDAQETELAARGMTALYREMELPLMRVLLSMEREGFLIDRAELGRQGETLRASETALREEIIESTGGVPFNLNSPKQLGEVLFERLGLPAGRKTKSGWSTDAETLEGLVPFHPAIDKLLEYRRVAKLNATYIEGLSQAIGEDGRVRSTFDQTATVTGRLSSNEPNLQNIPIRTPQGREIRRAFIARPGWLLLDADYSQIELRILAHLSNDPGMIEAFRKGQDIHARTAAEVYGVPLSEVTPAMRSASKAVNFGIVYGISDYGLARNIGVSRAEAAAFIERYFARYPGVRAFMDSAVKDGKTLGYAKTLLGRRRPLPELADANHNIRAFGERAAMNTPVQGAAADVIKLAMVRVAEALEKEGLRARLILQVHDELIVEAPREEAERASKLLQSIMEGVVKLSVPLVAEVHCGESWFDAK